MDESKAPVGNTNWYLSLVYRYRFVVPPGTNVKVTTRYLRLIHRFHPPQKYRYEDELVPMLPLVSVHLHTGTFGVDLRLVF